MLMHSFQIFMLAFFISKLAITNSNRLMIQLTQSAPNCLSRSLLILEVLAFYSSTIKLNALHPQNSFSPCKQLDYLGINMLNISNPMQGFSMFIFNGCKRCNMFFFFSFFSLSFSCHSQQLMSQYYLLGERKKIKQGVKWKKSS